jgi:glutamate:GABA antiporter
MWAFATCFLFINILRLYAQDRETFRSHAIVSVPLQLLSAVIGLVVGFLAILDTLFNSYIPPLIPNGQWFLVVGLLTFILLILGALGSMLASGEAAWQSYEETTT